MNQPKITKYAINATGGAFIAILATTWCRYVEIIEDDAAAAVGLQYQLPNDSFTATYDISAAHEPIKLGEPSYQGSTGPLLGHTAIVLQTDTSKIAAGNNSPATTLCNIKSFGAATTIQVKEWQ